MLFDCTDGCATPIQKSLKHYEEVSQSFKPSFYLKIAPKQHHCWNVFLKITYPALNLDKDLFNPLFTRRHTGCPYLSGNSGCKGSETIVRGSFFPFIWREMLHYCVVMMVQQQFKESWERGRIQSVASLLLELWKVNRKLKINQCCHLTHLIRLCINSVVFNGAVQHQHPQSYRLSNNTEAGSH